MLVRYNDAKLGTYLFHPSPVATRAKSVDQDSYDVQASDSKESEHSQTLGWGSCWMIIFIWDRSSRYTAWSVGFVS